MILSQKGIDLIKKSEAEGGPNLRPYLCPARKPTIGYGCTEYEDGTRVTMQDPAITAERAEALLAVLVRKFSQGVAKLVKVHLQQGEFDALVDFAFNLGIGNLANSTLLEKLNEGDRQGAADEFPKWCHANGKTLGGLVKRRAAERDLFLGED